MESSSFLERLDRLLDRWSDRLSPILIKETRQSIRSRSFALGFFAALSLCLGGSLMIVLGHWEEAARLNLGADCFRWHVMVLSAATCLFTPLGLFQSFSNEFQDNALEMLVITGLTGGQIVCGKLLTSCSQMAIYLSVVLPFLCFTYLLEGISLAGVVIAILICGTAGIFCCLGAMLFASLGKQTLWRLPGLFLSGVLNLLVCLGSGSLAQRMGLASDDPPTLGALLAGLSCFAYLSLFFSLLALGVAMSQFTLVRPRHWALRPIDRLGSGVRRGISPSPASPGLEQTDASGVPS